MFSITIITATLNCSKLLQKTIASIQNQTHKKIQWIVVDGGSIDGTVDMIKSSPHVTNWFSGHDDGIYDAWNKALPHVNGDWVIFLGAGDVFSNYDVLDDVSKILQDIPMSVGIAYGNVIQKFEGKEIYRYGLVDLEDWSCYGPKLPAHQGVFHRSSLFDNQLFDSSYKVVADSKFMFTALKKCDAFYLDVDVCLMEPGGISSHPLSAEKVLKEFFHLEKEMNYKIPTCKRFNYIIRTYLKIFIFKLFRNW